MTQAGGGRKGDDMKSGDGFRERATAYMAAAAGAARRWYDAGGDWVAVSLPPGARDRYWLAFSLYAMGEAQFADAIIRKGRTEYEPQQFCIFQTNTACALLVQHRDKMAADVRAILERFVGGGFDFYPGNRQPDFQFHGFNDNMPAKATMGLVLGGELLGNADAVEYGLWNLRQMRAMLIRRGTISEFNSPTYTPLTLHAMGEVAEYARHEEARELARAIEARLWLDMAARFHPEMGVVAGPYSRAYTVDTVASASLFSALLWFQLGDRVHPSPMELFSPPEDLVIHHAGDIPFNIAQFSWLAAGSYHIPERAREFFLRKAYPFRAVASFEVGGGDLDFPGRQGVATTLLQPDFTLGTATTPMGEGKSTMNYFVTYRRRKEIRSFRDVGTVYSKLVLDGHVPGTRRNPQGDLIEDARKTGGYHGEEDHLVSRANTMAFQDANTAVVLTHPHLALGDPPDNGAGPPLLRALSELIIFSSHFGGVEELLVGGEPRKDWQGEARRGEWIAMRRGRLLIGIRPMVYTRSFGPVGITLEKVNQYEVIRSTFYRGEPRAFLRQELREIFGGFVAEHASVDDYPSLTDFAALLSQARFTDYQWMTRRVRYRRPGNARVGALDFEASWTQGTCAPRYAMVNGGPIAPPAVEIDGLPKSGIPFLDEPFRPIPAFFPWKDFRNIWYDIPYAIGDREE